MKQLLVSDHSAELRNQTAHLLQAAGKGTLLLLGETADTVSLAQGFDQVLTMPPASSPASAPMEYADAIAKLVQQEHYETIAFYGNKLGHATAGLAAQKLGLPCYTEVLAVDNANNTLLRRVYASNLQAKFYTPENKVLTIARGKPTQRPDVVDYGTRAVVLEAEPAKWVLDTQLAARPCRNPLENAKLLFVAGKGIGNAKNYARLEQLAHKLGGMVGATRAVVLSGWAPLEAMIGQSGTIAAPEVCITFGASGAAPFLVGVEQSQKLIAINHDSSASIFRAAHQGMVADCVQILDEMEKQLK